MQILIRANNNLETAMSTVESVTEFTTFDLVLLVPSIQQSAVLYSWISPANTRFAERTLQRDPSFDEEGRFAYSARIFPVMTAGISSQQTSGMALCSFRIGAVFSPIIRISVDKSILPEQTEFMETDVENLQGQIDALNLGIATQNEAETGTVNNKYMTPLRTKQAISEFAPAEDLTVINNHIADTTIHFTQSEISITESQISDLGNYETANANIQTHIASTNNPHAVTKTQLGLGNVDNVQQIPLSQKGTASGVASLDGNSKIPVAQLPNSVFDSLYFFGSVSTNSDIRNLGLAAVDDADGSERSAKGYYWVITAPCTILSGTGTITVGGVSASTSGINPSEEGISSGTVATLETGDWFILTNINGAGTAQNPYSFTFAVVNNTYEFASDEVYGIVKLSDITTISNSTTGSEVITQGVLGGLIGNVENYGIATQGEAEAGTVNDKYMTPLRTKEAILELSGSNDFTAINAHIADSTIHFTQANISITENQISDFGSYEPANANIQTHIADSTLHFTQANISITESQISDLGTYEPANSNIQTHISATNNPHGVTATQLGVYTTAEADTAIGNAIAALVDTAPGTLDTLNELAAALGNDPNFATTVTNAIAGKSDIGHTHIKADITDFAHTHLEADITDLDKYTQTQVDTLLAGKSDVGHIHDDRYYTETELNNGQLNNLYYTETEVDTFVGGLQDELDTINDTLGDIDTILASVLGV